MYEADYMYTNTHTHGWKYEFSYFLLLLLCVPVCEYVFNNGNIILKS